MITCSQKLSPITITDCMQLSVCEREGERPLLLHFARHLLGIWPTPSPHDCAIESDLSSLDSEFSAVTNELMFLSRLCLAGKRYHRSVVRGRFVAHPKGVRPSCPSLTTTPSLPSPPIWPIPPLPGHDFLASLLHRAEKVQL